MPNLSEHLSNAATTAQLSARFGYAAAMKSLNNLLLLGDGETWARQRVDFAGLPEMVRTFLQVAAGAADIPVTRLLGQSPAGLSATGDSDIRNYYDTIAARQEIDLRPQLERLDRLLMASAGLAPGTLTFTFRPLWQMDAATKAATALQKAQATAIYAGLGLWPKDVVAGLVAGQLAEDGIYPDAGAAFEAAAETEGAQQPVRDYSPDQPRDPQGRWTEGGGIATIGTEGIAGNGVTAETPHNLTIHPKVSQPSSSEGTHTASRSGVVSAILTGIGNVLKFLNPISPAHAAGPEEDENRSAEGEADPMSGIREDLYYSAYNELKAIDPKNPEFGPVSRTSNWTPSNEDVRRVETALELARISQARSSPPTSPRQDPDTVSPFAPTSEQVNRAAPEPPMSLPRSPAEEMLERIARENPFRLSVGRATIPEGGFGSIVRASGVTISVGGSSPRELGYSYEQGIRDTFGSGKSEGDQPPSGGPGRMLVQGWSGC